jgi:hypothetical protein
LRLLIFPLASFGLSLLDDIFVRSIFVLFSRSFCRLSGYQTLDREQVHSQRIVSFRGSFHRTLLILQQSRAKPFGMHLSGLPPCVVCRNSQGMQYVIPTYFIDHDVDGVWCYHLKADSKFRRDAALEVISARIPHDRPLS